VKHYGRVNRPPNLLTLKTTTKQQLLQRTYYTWIHVCVPTATYLPIYNILQYPRGPLVLVSRSSIIRGIYSGA